jgi:dTDP-4-dehydrorhamnose 3,5-epimerase
MRFEPSIVEGAHVIDITPIPDHRGFFARTWCETEFAGHGLVASWSQSNMQGNPEAGTLRGLHFQEEPFGETKLVRCTAGSVFDVIVDVRPASPTYLRWTGVELSAGNHRMMWVPTGCAHGYLTLQPGSEVHYLTSHEYVPSAAKGIRYDDPTVGVQWPAPVTTISESDLEWPLLGDPLDR